MPKYLVVHKHADGGNAYEVETDFDLLEATGEYPDWDLRLAEALGLDYQRWRDEEINMCPLEEIPYQEVSQKEFLGIDISDEESVEKTRQN